MTGLLGALLTAALAAAAASDGLFVALRPGLFPFLLLVLAAIAAAASGRRLARALGARGLREDETTVAGATLGLGLLSFASLALAAFGVLTPASAAALLGALALYGRRELRPLAESAAAAARAALTRPGLCALIGLPLLAALWSCWAPPHQYDSLVYHLALPQEYLRAGRIDATAGIVYAHFPQNGEMLFALALALGSDLLAQMLVWLAAALTVAWLLTFGRRLTAAAPWAAALVATHTAVLLLSSTTYVEPLVMLWTTAALLAFEASREGERRGPLVLSALFAGLALGAKYYAGLLCALLALRLLWRGRFRTAALFSAIVSALFAPWLIKNWLLAGDPVFPFLYRIFPATAVGWSADLAAGYFSVLTEYGHAHGFWIDLLSLPVLLLRNPLRFGGGMDALGDLGWDLTLWLWPVGLWAAWKGRGPRGLALFTVLYAAGWFCTGVVLRFLTALVPALALVGAAGAADWRSRSGAPARALAAGAAGLLVASHLFLFLYVHGVFGTASVLLALESREEFLSKRLDYYPCAAFADAALGPDDKVLLVGEQRGYYLTRAHLATTVHAPNLYVRRANEASSPRELVRTLRADGFTHLLFVPREEQRLAGGVGSFTERGRANWRSLAAGLKTVHRGPACLVASLGDR